jgi:hypothetical protein
MEESKGKKTNLTPQVSSPFFFKVDFLSVTNVPWQKISKSDYPIDEHVQISIRKDFRKSSVLDYERPYTIIPWKDHTCSITFTENDMK